MKVPVIPVEIDFDNVDQQKVKRLAGKIVDCLVDEEFNEDELQATLNAVAHTVITVVFTDAEEEAVH